MKILYLYTEVMGYTMATLQELVKYGAQVHVIHWVKHKQTPLKIKELHGATFYPREELHVDDMVRLAAEIDPVITVVSGWVDTGYLSVAAWLRHRNYNVICALDGQWHGTIRQTLATSVRMLKIVTRFFSHAWVPGYSQYEFARRLGFKTSNIILDLYSADLTKFDTSRAIAPKAKSESYPHVFLYVGRFAEEKGLDLLCDAWQQLGDNRQDWELLLIGAGASLPPTYKQDALTIRRYLQPDDLALQISRAGCFVLPSRFEPWGVVIHESAAAGLPILVSSSVGAAGTFVINNYNGFVFDSNSSAALRDSMAMIISQTDHELRIMGDRSAELSLKITPQSSAANLISICDTRHIHL